MGLATKIFKIRLRLRTPPHVDVLIYDRVGAQFILRALDKQVHYGILDVRNSAINIHPYVLCQLAFLILRRKNSKGEYWAKAGIRLLFELSEIWVMRPKVVVSFVDNSRGFNLLSRLYESASFFGIQNGFRGIEVADMAHYLFLTNFLCFGQETKNRYESEGCDVSRFIIAGSLKNGLYMEESNHPPEKLYDLCWVSQYRPARFDTSMPTLRDNSLLLLDFVQRYCLEQGKTLAIACSCKERGFSHEYRFLLSKLKLENVKIVPNDDNNFSSYRLIDQSKVTVTVNSTIGFEALARGNKVLFCNYSNDEYFDVPSGYSEGVWALRDTSASFDKFSRKVSEIYDATDQKWRDDTQAMAQHFVRAESHLLPQEILRKEITNCLSGIG